MGYNTMTFNRINGRLRQAPPLLVYAIGAIDALIVAKVITLLCSS